MSVRSCQLLEKCHVKNLMKLVDNFFFDCDGVLWTGNNLIPGGKDVITKLQQMGKRVYLITNNNANTRQQYVQKCSKLGITMQEENIACTAHASALYIHSIGFKDKVYLVGSPNLGDELANFGISHTGLGPDPVDGDIDEWCKIQLDDEVKCVLVGFDPHLSFMKIMKAASYAKRNDCLFIVTNEDAIYPSTGDVVIPGTGTMIAPIKLAAEREPIVIGKPSSNMFDLMKQMHGVDAARSLMVGDRLCTDVAMANNCHMLSILVLSGVASVRDVENVSAMPANCLPSYYTNSVKDIYDMIVDL